MAAVTKDAKVVGIKERGVVIGADPATNAAVQLQTLELTVLLGEGTAGEQRVTFMVLESDYQALGSPTYAAPVTLTLTNPAVA